MHQSCLEQEYWQPQFSADGYGSCFTKKAQNCSHVSDSLEGCLLVYKEEALELLEIRELPLRDLFRYNSLVFTGPLST
ncbi:PDE12 [Symbiodinium sp. CCMP2592]|nr:PDE12 [Symbiodinium sp. CCMP2592]